VALNYMLNPLLIYGTQAGEMNSAWGAENIGRLAEFLGIEGYGIAGAGMATGIARTLIVTVAIFILWRILNVPLLMRGTWQRTKKQVLAIARISGPSAASIAFYAAAYLALIRFVFKHLGDDALAGLGIGFQVFEGLSFPCYLGLAIAGSSLVGREIGARNPSAVAEVVGSARALGRILGLTWALLFYFVGPYAVQIFTQDPEVAQETIGYVRILAFSQYWVAVESINEKTLLGSGQTRSIMWISMLGNFLRLPIGWLFATGMYGLLPNAMLGAAGVWWSINVTTLLKAYLFWGRVQAGDWLHAAMAEEIELTAQK
jgi:Na+-driven multidrug efflux pump